jgi:HK97 family phage prohead protease
MKLEDKLKTHYQVKAVNIMLSDLDEGSRKVKGYFASFDTIDSDMDVIRKGAFAKSIQEKGVDSTSNRKIAHLRNHDWEQQIGKILELKEDSTGLYFVSQLGRSTKGEDAFLDYQDGILREHSIGFNYVQDKIKHVPESTFSPDGHFEVLEVKLWEGSAVTFGANSLTPVLDVAKGQDKALQFKKLTELSEAFFKAIKNGKGTDDRLENIEAMFKQIQQLQQSLIESKPSVKDTSITTEPKRNDYHNSLIKLLTN